MTHKTSDKLADAVELAADGDWLTLDGRRLLRRAAAHIREQDAEVKRLRAVVDRLPVDVAGNPIAPGMMVAAPGDSPGSVIWVSQDCVILPAIASRTTSPVIRGERIHVVTEAASAAGGDDERTI